MSSSSDETDVARGSQDVRVDGPNVLDASALLIMLLNEPGADEVTNAIVAGATVSAANLSEVAVVLRRHASDAERILAAVMEQVVVAPFTAEDALLAAALSAPTRALGLSLGDCACVALARRLGLPAVTADRVWAQAHLGIKIYLVR